MWINHHFSLELREELDPAFDPVEFRAHVFGVARAVCNRVGSGDANRGRSRLRLFGGYRNGESFIPRICLRGNRSWRRPACCQNAAPKVTHTIDCYPGALRNGDAAFAQSSVCRFRAGHMRAANVRTSGPSRVIRNVSQPPAIAPTTRSGSAPVAEATSGNGVSGTSCDRSRSQAKKPHERTTFAGDTIANRAGEHGIARFERVEDRVLRWLARDRERDFAFDAGQRTQLSRQHNADHGNVCTSTESTAGRSRTIGSQFSPASLEAYTAPPVVPKYTPQGSSWSTDIASRSTLT